MSRVDVWLIENGFGNIVRREAVGGGCINNSIRLHLDLGTTVFLKENSDAPADMFQAEAIGLQALAARKALKIPDVIHVEEDFLLIEDLGEGTESDSYWKLLGEGLAQLHEEAVAEFGFSVDNYCGSTPQQNTIGRDGFEFFANYRLLKLASSAFHRNLLDRQDLSALESIAANLPRWIPQQDAVLIHGDLWNGNVHCAENGRPALIDPAAYWGWAEAELAMTDLFGGFSQLFYESYESNSGIDSEWRERIPLYNLYHLLNHLLLFGTSYLTPIQNIIRRFA
ncbi:MAG: phosphotransferase [Pseudomonadales bacterium]|nr:phosphotransferase [Pseudomonadales bacterium]